MSDNFILPDGSELTREQVTPILIAFFSDVPGFLEWLGVDLTPEVIRSGAPAPGPSPQPTDPAPTSPDTQPLTNVLPRVGVLATGTEAGWTDTLEGGKEYKFTCSVNVPEGKTWSVELADARQENVVSGQWYRPNGSEAQSGNISTTFKRSFSSNHNGEWTIGITLKRTGRLNLKATVREV